MILCSPHNPIERVWKEEELIKVIEIWNKNNVILVYDEIHSDLIRESVKFISTARSNIEGNKDLILCTSPSKTLNIVGLPLSNFIIFKNR